MAVDVTDYDDCIVTLLLYNLEVRFELTFWLVGHLFRSVSHFLPQEGWSKNMHTKVSFPVCTTIKLALNYSDFGRCSSVPNVSARLPLVRITEQNKFQIHEHHWLAYLAIWSFCWGSRGSQYKNLIRPTKDSSLDAIFNSFGDFIYLPSIIRFKEKRILKQSICEYA